MLRSLVSTARRQRLVAVLGVIALSLSVPPAFGAPSVASQVKTALKLAKKADKNATAALKLAKTASAGTSGEAGTSGTAGPKGATGAAGVAGAKGDTGAAGNNGAAGTPGAAGPKGDTGAAGAAGAPGAKGDKGEKGDIGPQGPAGPAGTGGSGGGSSNPALATRSNPEVLQQNVGTVPVSNADDSKILIAIPPQDDQAYVMTVHVAVSNTAPGVSVGCGLEQGGTFLDKAQVTTAYNAPFEDMSLTGLVPASTNASHIRVVCSADNVATVQASLTGVPVSN